MTPLRITKNDEESGSLASVRWKTQNKINIQELLGYYATH